MIINNDHCLGLRLMPNSNYKVVIHYLKINRLIQTPMRECVGAVSLILRI